MGRSYKKLSTWPLLVALVASSQLRGVRTQSLAGFEPLGGFAGATGTMVLHKRLFLDADCRGPYAPHFYGYLNRMHNICKECADMYPGMRDFISRNCTSECFRNRVFQDCVSATMQLHQLDEISNMIGQLSGRRK